MNITEVRIKLVEGTSDKLRGFANITVEDSLVIRDLKVIDGPRGLFVAMPSRKIHDHCPGCGGKNPLRARFCCECGRKLGRNRAIEDPTGRVRLYADIAHPIHQRGRREVQRIVIAAFVDELERSKREGYVPQRFDDIDLDTPPPGWGGDRTFAGRWDRQ